MLLYLVKFTHKQNNTTAYKRGISKWPAQSVIAKRFENPQYDLFNIELIDSFQYSHSKYSVAKLVLETIEQVLNGLVPPKKPEYSLEEHFGDPKGSYGNFDGVTEFIVDIDQNILEDTFKRATKNIWKVKT